MMSRTQLVLFVLIHVSLSIVGNMAEWNVSFPLTENQLNNLSCEKRWSCVNALSSSLDGRVLNIRERNCACQESCLYFRDCCSDYEGVNRTIPAYYSRIPIEYFQCINKSKVSSFGHYSVAACPEDMRNTTVGRYCETGSEDDLFIDLPVTGSRSRHTFKNMYCAICHGEHYIYWNVSFSCKQQSNLNSGASLQNIYKNRHCDMKYIPPEPKLLHLCLQRDENASNCLPEFAGTETVQLCNEAKDFSKAVFTASNEIFKNKYCAACRNVMPMCYPNIFATSRAFYPFTVLVNINKNDVNANNETYDCPQSTVFNPISLSCIKVYCPETWMFQDGVCIPKNIETSTVNPSRENTSYVNASTIVWDDGTDSCRTLNCPYLRFNQSKFVIQNGTLQHLQTSKTFSPSEFILNNDSVHVCVDAFLAKVDGFKPKLLKMDFNGTEGIVTFIGMLISLIALCITLIIYTIFPQLRNVPGKIILSLSVCLLVADVLMMVAPEGESSYTACVSLAILMHFFFLSAFFWMNVSALNIYFTFAKSFVNADSGTNRNRFIKFCLYAWISPAVVVAISVILNFSDIDWRYQPAYGRVICWISNPLPLIIFFLCPLLVILCVNVICFTLAVKKICSAKRSSSRILGTVNKLDILIYFKLSLVIGVTWIFGILVAFVSHPAVAYIFIILNTLQGVFICLAFVCTRRVFSLIRERAQSTRRSSTSSGKSVKTATYRLSS